MPSSSLAHRPMFLGHRGVRGEKSIPENSFAAFDFALSQGCDGFEFDVRLSADGQAVICHDPTTRGLEIAKSSARELALPLLADTLQRYQASAFLDIELKVPGLEKIVLDRVQASPPRLGYVVSSFLPDVLLQIYSLRPAIPLGLICETSAQFRSRTSLPIQYVIPHHRLLGKKEVAAIRSEGKTTLVWTVNAPGDIQQYVKWGADGVITDHPRLSSLPRHPGSATPEK